MPPYDATAEQMQRDIESYVDAVYGSLESQFLVLPQGPGFVEYARFQAAYEVLKKATSGFRALRPAAVWDALLADSRRSSCCAASWACLLPNGRSWPPPIPASSSRKLSLIHI